VKRPIQIILILSVLFAFAVLRWQWIEREDPHYKGKRISTWVLESNDPDPLIRKAAIFSLQSLGSTVLPTLLSMLHKNPYVDPIDDFRYDRILQDRLNKESLVAAEAFRFLDPEIQKAAIPQLGDLLINTWTSDRAAYALSFMGSKAIPALIRGLTNESPRVQECTLRGITATGHEAESAVPDLLKLLKEKKT
jgi:hypothetical protein